jgi:predicted DCC family thiol-disulfide oxidoreductase YuxK
MRNIILYAGSCPACSRVARLVTDTSIAGLEARPFDDLQVSELLAGAGLQTPERPALVVTGGAEVQLLTGWAMRRHLAALVGWRRSGTIARLLAAEWRARLTRPVGLHAPSRRGVLGGAAAGILGWAMSSGVANAATRSAESTPALKAASPADAARVLETASAQRAIRAWGPAEQQVLETTGGGRPVLVLRHPDRDIYTFIDNSPDVHGGEPAAISVGAAPTAEHALRYYTVNGGALADLTMSDGHATVAPVQLSPGEVEPDISKTDLLCWLGCIGAATTSPSCITSCESCAIGPNGLGKAIACALCTICAGQNGVNCLYACGILQR